MNTKKNVFNSPRLFHVWDKISNYIITSLIIME